jgi:hypothetical protein
VFLAGHVDDVDEVGQPVLGDNLLLMLNSSHENISFQLPEMVADLPSLEVLLDTANQKAVSTQHYPKDPFNLQARSLVLFRWPFT